MQNTRADTSTENAVLVAVDGSDESLRALEWAIDYAKARRMNLRIVTAASPIAMVGADGAGTYLAAHLDPIELARNRVAAAIDVRLAGTGVSYDHVVALGTLKSTLADHSDQAHLVVVGTRDTKGWRRWFRCSATNQLTGSLSCPVLSIPTAATEAKRSPPAVHQPQKEAVSVM